MTTDRDFTDWYRLQGRRASALREGLCTCCAFTTRVGEPWPRPVRAVAEWITPVGNRSLLCESCLGFWQANAADDPELAPKRLTMLSTGGTR